MVLTTQRRDHLDREAAHALRHSGALGSCAVCAFMSGAPERVSHHHVTGGCMKRLTLNVEELEQRIAPDGIGGTPGTGTSNSNGHGTEDSGGSKPQAGPGREGERPRPFSRGA